jgi:ATP-dependent DNA ligase
MIFEAGEVLDNVIAGVIPNIDAEGKIRLRLHGQVRLDSSWPAGIYTSMLRMRPRLSGFIEPCLPSPAPNPPVGHGWIHEIKLDGFRLLARRDAAGVRLLTRRGIDWTNRYPT